MNRRFFLAERFIFALCLLLFFIFATSAAFASPWREDRPITVGHRGTRVLADENTMAAYRAAWEHGVDVIECDPKLTRDGVYVIMHDDTVDRTTNGKGKVADMTLAQIKELQTPSGEKVPTLSEVLVFARDHGLSVYLDIKSPPADGAKLLVKMVEDAGMTDRVIAGCWQKETCRMVKKQNPGISTCISWPYPVLTFKQARRLGADAVGTLTSLAGKQAIKSAHKAGLKIITMPIDSEEQLKKFKARGLDGLQSDDPRLLQ